MAENNPENGQDPMAEFARRVVQQDSRIHLNLGQEFIFTTEDKLRLCLTSHLHRVEARRSWIAPLGILVTILVVIPSTTFKTFLFSPDTWTAIFTIAGISSLIWLIRSAIKARVSASLDTVVAEIKKHVIQEAEAKSANQDSSRAVQHLALAVTTAVYGAGTQFVDVRHILASSIRNDRLELPVNNVTMTSDPIPGTPKILKVQYSVGENTFNAEVREGELLSIP